MLARRMLTLLMATAALAAVSGCGDDTGGSASSACEDAITERLDGADEAVALAACRDAGQDIDQALQQVEDTIDDVKDPVGAAEEAALQKCREEASELPGPAGAAAREACNQAIN